MFWYLIRTKKDGFKRLHKMQAEERCISKPYLDPHVKRVYNIRVYMYTVFRCTDKNIRGSYVLT